MYPAVKDVQVKEKYKLKIKFNNGKEGTLNMLPFLDFGVFQKIKEPEAFKKVRVAFDTIEWDAGVDLDPEFVYEQCFGKDE